MAKLKVGNPIRRADITRRLMSFMSSVRDSTVCCWARENRQVSYQEWLHGLS